MRAVEWSAEALADFDDQINFIALSSKKNAALVADRVEQPIALLLSTPTGRFGRIEGTYEKLVSKTSPIGSPQAAISPSPGSFMRRAIGRRGDSRRKVRRAAQFTYLCKIELIRV
jgi:hypothetical protein